MTMCWWDKEVRYFSRGPRAGVDFCWYTSLFPCVPAEETRAVYEGSPDYLVMPEASVAHMARRLGTSARLVAIFRNPADRFYSAYNMGMNEAMHRKGPETSYAGFAASLDRFIACAPECPSEKHVVSMFFEYGMYAKHLRTYFKHFARSRLLVLCSEDYYSNPASTMMQLLEFAQLSTTSEVLTLVAGSEGVRRNRGSEWGGNYTGKLLGRERDKLQAFYAPHNKELYALIGRDFGWDRVGATARSQPLVAHRPIVEL
jgi:hypothetical protein